MNHQHIPLGYYTRKYFHNWLFILVTIVLSNASFSLKAERYELSKSYQLFYHSSSLLISYGLKCHEPTCCVPKYLACISNYLGTGKIDYESTNPTWYLNTACKISTTYYGMLGGRQLGYLLCGARTKKPSQIQGLIHYSCTYLGALIGAQLGSNLIDFWKT